MINKNIIKEIFKANGYTHIVIDVVKDDLHRVVCREGYCYYQFLIDNTDYETFEMFGECEFYANMFGSKEDYHKKLYWGE